MNNISMIDFLDSIDKSLLLWLNSFHTPFWDNIMWFISGKVEWIPLYTILLGFIIYKFRWKSIYILFGIALVIVLADRISVEVFKEVVKRPRPTHCKAIKHLVHTVNNYRGGAYGFVSSHAANSFAIATYLTFIFRKKYFTWFMFFWALVVSYSRVYLGVHYPGDVFCGALLGTACGMLGYFILVKLNNRFNLKVLE